MTFRSSTPALSAKALVKFPTRVEGGSGISAAKANGTWTFSLDVGSLAENASPDAATSFLVIWNSETEVYERVSLATIITMAGA